ncbi:bacillithiol biosynthesis cysteine-adding enzyme BshC [Salinibacillus xinjiangensis]|uniref:Putative cysteine ligase BshC n=1 Tax=Salinibacillus xinjiangensis TaxID=1229268 RepID=A0A6G1X3H6_9BACI|nr:bacillithiol biosynthesis cysteine-adding enzyme BshC [Salinibacillus xinjiangensis]MRG85502.1 bacillithiol biosynthesis cysteine-adding enzyme BshC [Salinibacillus xinjiangensis]
MNVKPISILSKPKIVKDYRNQAKEALQFFQYNPFEEGVFQKRLDDLSANSYQRKELQDVLKSCNQKWNAPAHTFKNIERLGDEKSVVVVGGQQAGLLTGPLYSIHKMISVIRLAKEQEKELGVPVIPVFWIAGEDHDYEEINHVFLPKSHRMKKFKTLQRQESKKSVSHMKLDKNQTHQWLDNLFINLTETEHTRTLHNEFKAIIDNSETFVDFFAKVTFYLLQSEGLVLMDSGDASIRKLESPYFVNMIRRQTSLAKGVTEKLNEASVNGYHIPLDADVEDGHLFYHLDGERVLLSVNDNGKWVGKNDECSFTAEELIQIAEESPQLLSNNVVTRPIMQELLLPVLAFIGGPGEIAYWSVLKSAFETLDQKMPPVIPRLSYTLVDAKSQKQMRKLALDVGRVINEGIDAERSGWLKRQTNPPIEELSDQVKLSIEKIHQPIRQLAKEIEDDVGQLAEKNLAFLLREIDYLGERMEYSVRKKHWMTLQKYEHIEMMLHPEGGLQERTWSILYWLNHYGDSWISNLIDQKVGWNQDHFAVYL